MSSVIRLKRSSVRGKIPTTSNISTGELALNLADKRIYSSNGNATFEIGSNPDSLAVGTGGFSIANGSIIFPSGDGTNGQILVTDGSGQLSFANNTSPVNGSLKANKLDSITAVGNTSTYPLQLNGTSYQPAFANSLLVSLNGVIQEPGTSFSLSGNNIVFDTALQADDVINFIVDYSSGSFSISQNINVDNLTTQSFSSVGISDNATSTTINLVSNNNVGINTSTPSFELEVVGDIRATGNLLTSSDNRLKHDVSTLDGSKVYDMRGVQFFKDNKKGSGVIAQELLEVAPELVESDGEYLSVSYGNLVGYLIEAIKDLNNEVQTLKNQINRLED
jgi:hypothetical protein